MIDQKLKSMRIKYRIGVLIACVVISIVLLLSFIYFIKKSQDVYVQQATKMVYEVKSNFLQNTVDNVIIEIERKEAEELSDYKQIIEHLLVDATQIYSHDPSQFLQQFEASYMDEVKTYELAMQLSKGGQVTYVTGEYANELVSDDGTHFSYVSRAEIGDFTLHLGITRTNLQSRVEQSMANQIRSATFTSNTYMWVNEVVNYDGGDNYAIRRVHPNLVETEGQYLSTSMEDIKGNLPYLEELEGVKEHGDLFFTYFFKNLHDNQIEEKLTYARLYEPYDWIIAMGMPLDEIEAFAETAAQETEDFINQIIWLFAGLALLLFGLLIVVSYRLENWYYHQFRNQVQKDLHADSLTNAFNRRRAEQDLQKLFEHYQETGESPITYVIDIDNFKKINDTYGHEVGDEVLRKMVRTLQNNTRYTDVVYRWGGEEFIVICTGVQQKQAIQVGEKFLQCIRQDVYLTGRENFSITASIGVATFEEQDKDFSAMIHRADMAMYKAKTAGKNRICS